MKVIEGKFKREVIFLKLLCPRVILSLIKWYINFNLAFLTVENMLGFLFIFALASTRASTVLAYFLCHNLSGFVSHHSDANLYGSRQKRSILLFPFPTIWLPFICNTKQVMCLFSKHFCTLKSITLRIFKNDFSCLNSPSSCAIHTSGWHLLLQDNSFSRTAAWKLHTRIGLQCHHPTLSQWNSFTLC